MAEVDRDCAESLLHVQRLNQDELTSPGFFNTFKNLCSGSFCVHFSYLYIRSILPLFSSSCTKLTSTTAPGSALFASRVTVAAREWRIAWTRVCVGSGDVGQHRG